MKITDEQRGIIDNIKPMLPHGAQGKIAEMAGVTRETVNKVLNKKWWNQRVINACLELIQDNRQRIQQLGKNLLNQ